MLQNLYNLAVLDSTVETSRNPMKQAVAARIYGDKSAFYACSFTGGQDTLWDAQGRHFSTIVTLKELLTSFSEMDNLFIK